MMTGAFTQGKGTAEYTYNGFRARVRKLETFHDNALPDPERDIRYTLDLTKPYDNLLMTRGSQKQSFTWGSTLLEATGDTAADSFYYLHDHLGSPVRLLGGNGNDEALAFDEFGVPLVGAPNMNQPFGFTGYQTEDISELYYAQARYYEPGMGRFTAEDIIHSGLNWYGYCNANPLGWVDPRGLEIDENAHDTQETPSASLLNGNNLNYSFWNVSGQFRDELLFSSGSTNIGYAEGMVRFQAQSSDPNMGMLGIFGKASGINIQGLVGVGNDDDIASSLKGVGDVLTATLRAGIQYQNGIGVAAQAKASVLSGRATIQLDLFGWEVEFGVTGDAISAGIEIMAGYFPDDGFAVKAGASAFVGGGILIRVKPDW